MIAINIHLRKEQRRLVPPTHASNTQFAHVSHKISPIKNASKSKEGLEKEKLRQKITGEGLCGFVFIRELRGTSKRDVSRIEAITNEVVR